MIDTINLRLHGANQQVTSNLEKIKADNLNISIAKVPEHFELYSKLLQFKGKSFQIKRNFNHEELVHSNLSDDEFLTLKTSKQVNNYYLSTNKQSFVCESIEKQYNLNARGKYSINSQSYNIVFKINPNAGYIDFQFSIPKYLYSHSLAQFIPQINSKAFYKNSHLHHGFNFQKKNLYSRLIKFIDFFFLELCTKFKIDTLPNYEYIEINRIDLCYNQYFENKEIALMYLDHQKKIHKKSSNKQSKNDNNYNTSLTIGRSKGNYFKIYHKGSEYVSKTGDYKKHKEINMNHWKNLPTYKTDQYGNKIICALSQSDTYTKHFNYVNEIFEKKIVQDISLDQFFSIPDDYQKKDKQKLADYMSSNFKINTPFLKKEMDKILRYELSISGLYLSTIYKNSVFRNNCSVHKYYKEIYKKVKRIDNRKDSYKYKISDYEQKIYSSFHQFLNRKTAILLKVTPTINRYLNFGKYSVQQYSENYKFHKIYNQYNKGTLLETNDIGLFNEDLLFNLVTKFENVINEFQISELKPYDNFLDNIHELNRGVKERVNQYNTQYSFLTTDLNDKPIIHKRKVIKYAIELLSDKEKTELNLKKINPIMIMEFYRLMVEDNLSISQVRDKLKLDKYAFFRRKKILEHFNVHENTINITIPILPKTNFEDYYFQTDSIFYQSKFFIDSNMSEFDFNSYSENINTNPKFHKHEFEKSEI